MKKIIFLLVFNFSPNFAQAQEPDVEWKRLEKYREEIKKRGNSCTDVKTSEGVVRLQGPNGDLRIQLFKNQKSVSTQYLPSMGTPSQRCLDVQYFAGEEILVYKVYKGQSLPAGIEVYSLAVYKMKDAKITGGLEYVLLDIDQEAESEIVKSFKLLPRDEKTGPFLEMFDQKSNSAIKPVDLSKLDYR